MKPDPRIFRLALDAMGVDAGDAWYVGDMPAIDVVGARRAGLRPVPHRPARTAPSDADYDRVASLTELARPRRRGLSPGLPPALARAGRADGRDAEFTPRDRATPPPSADELAQWVGDFLASAGSDNAGPRRRARAGRALVGRARSAVPVDDLVRLAGPEDEALVPIEPEEWEDDVDAMEESLDDGWEPPPLLAEYQDGRLLLQDGNHRYEALVRAGESHAWTLVYFDDRRDLDEFRRRPRSPDALTQRNLSLTFSLVFRAVAFALSAVPFRFNFLFPVSSPAATLALPFAFCAALFAFVPAIAHPLPVGGVDGA